MLQRAAVVVLATLATVTGVTGCERAQEPPEPAPTVRSTGLADFPTDGLAVARADFCSRVAPTAISDALGGEAVTTRSYGNGDRALLAPGTRDVAHEYACTWRAADGTEARAWVFAPPVTPAQARALRSTVLGPGCRAVRGAPAYGDPSVAVRCGPETSFHGLFGDAWLSCSITASGRGGQDVRIDRAGRWCVTVAQAASA